jgi:hypothetical protein
MPLQRNITLGLAGYLRRTVSAARLFAYTAVFVNCSFVVCPEAEQLPFPSWFSLHRCSFAWAAILSRSARSASRRLASVPSLLDSIIAYKRRCSSARSCSSRSCTSRACSSSHSRLLSAPHCSSATSACSDALPRATSSCRSCVESCANSCGPERYVFAPIRCIHRSFKSIQQQAKLNDGISCCEL